MFAAGLDPARPDALVERAAQLAPERHALVAALHAGLERPLWRAQAVHRLRRSHCWLITGSPVQNNIKELQTLLTICNPSLPSAERHWRSLCRHVLLHRRRWRSRPVCLSCSGQTARHAAMTQSECCCTLGVFAFDARGLHESYIDVKGRLMSRLCRDVYIAWTRVDIVCLVFSVLANIV